MYEQNRAPIRRYIQAVDENVMSDWSILDEFVEYWSVSDVARVLQQIGVLPGPKE